MLTGRAKLLGNAEEGASESRSDTSATVRTSVGKHICDTRIESVGQQHSRKHDDLAAK